MKYRNGLLLTVVLVLASACVAGEEASRRGAEDAGAETSVTVWYSTDRARDENGEKDTATYSKARSHVTYGVAEIILPPRHLVGRLEEPALASAGSVAERRWYVSVDRTETMRRDSFVDALSAGVAASKRQQLMLYVHGFNTDFDHSLRRAAQIAYDLKYDGAAMAFAWPSAGNIASYLADLNNADWAVPHLAETLRLVVREAGAERIDLVAHSMGGRLLLAALGEISRERQPLDPPLFGNVIFAAPDVDSAIFKVAIERLRPLADRYTLYVSSNDLALAASRQLAGDHPRAGESGEGMVVISDMDTIDASAVGDDLFGHEYFGESGPVLDDIGVLLREGAAPSDRPGLTREFYLGRSYWRLLRPEAKGS